MRNRIIAGNWKMNSTVSESEQLVKDLLAGNTRREGTAVVVCPPYTSLYTCGKLLEGTHIQLGAQDMSDQPKGAFTGDISAEMLLTAGATWVILGHSERRQHHAETDQQVNAKLKAALANKLTPIICVGESDEQREAGTTEKVVTKQVSDGLAGLGPTDLSRVVIAYEPIWAIGTGKTATPDQAQEVHALIRETVAGLDAKAAEQMPILYGGSVKPGNADGLLSQDDIDGALVGGASLKAADFAAIINAA